MVAFTSLLSGRPRFELFEGLACERFINDVNANSECLMCRVCRGGNLKKIWVTIKRVVRDNVC